MTRFRLGFHIFKTSIYDWKRLMFCSSDDYPNMNGVLKRLFWQSLNGKILGSLSKSEIEDRKPPKPENLVNALQNTIHRNDKV